MEKLINSEANDILFIKKIVHEKMIKLGFSLDCIEKIKEGAAGRDNAYVSYKKRNYKGVVNILFVYYPTIDIFITRKYYLFILKYFRKENFISIIDSQNLKRIKDTKEWKKFILNTLDYIKEKELIKL